MKRWLLSVGLAVLLGWQGQATAHAQEMAMPQAQGPAVMMQPQYAVASPECGMDWGVPPLPPWQARVITSLQPPPPPPPDPFVLRRIVVSCLNQCGIGCYATHNTIGCQSCHAQLTYVFGSCRQWYGTPCIPQPPKPHPCLDTLRSAGLFGGAGTLGGSYGAGTFGGNYGGGGGCPGGCN